MLPMSLPHDLASLENVPHGRTARRLEWSLLPPMLRRLIENKLESPVISAASAGSGFTPGMASALTCANGQTTFVKAASIKAQKAFANSYREEIDKLRSLPVGLPLPRLLWSHEDDLWVVLALEYVDATTPERPWRSDQLDACLDALEVIADGLTPPTMKLATFADDFAGCLTGWAHLRTMAPGWPHLNEAAALAARFTTVTAGNTLVHTDARDDNFLLTRDGRALLCDWNWPAVGAAWIDTVLLLISAYGDGMDADGVIAQRRLTKAVDPEHIDILLALVCGYFMESRDHPVPNSSPYIRVHARWYSEVTWAWLSQRRGWS